MKLILYSKPGCHLCEGLQEKLEQVEGLNFELEIRDITTQEAWFQQYQYEVPVLCKVGLPDGTVPEFQGSEQPLPRPSPRASVRQLEKMLQKYLGE